MLPTMERVEVIPTKDEIANSPNWVNVKGGKRVYVSWVVAEGTTSGIRLTCQHCAEEVIITLKAIATRVSATIHGIMRAHLLCPQIYGKVPQPDLPDEDDDEEGGVKPSDPIDCETVDLSDIEGLFDDTTPSET